MQKAGGNSIPPAISHVLPFAVLVEAGTPHRERYDCIYIKWSNELKIARNSARNRPMVEVAHRMRLSMIKGSTEKSIHPWKGSAMVERSGLGVGMLSAWWWRRGRALDMLRLFRRQWPVFGRVCNDWTIHSLIYWPSYWSDFSHFSLSHASSSPQYYRRPCF